MSTTRAATSGGIDFGEPLLLVRTSRMTLRIARRSLLVCVALLALTLCAVVVALCLGDLPLSPLEVLGALVGGDEGIVRIVVGEWRAPRALAAAVFGAALGVSGAVFQALTRNPLASPDIVGFSAGSYTGALIVIIVLGGGYAQTAAGALIGGLATALVVYLLSYRRGVRGFRFIIIGIGVSAMLASANTFLLLRAELEVAMSAATWGAGSLGSTGWAQLLPASAVIAVALVVIGAGAAPLRQLGLGDDAARALGVRTEGARLALIVAAVGLVAAVTAAAGPIAFVALAAPQIARRLARTAGVTLLPSAWMGAFLLVVSDLVAQHALPQSLPVGIVTVVVGGAYLVWLLIREATRRA